MIIFNKYELDFRVLQMQVILFLLLYFVLIVNFPVIV